MMSHNGGLRILALGPFGRAVAERLAVLAGQNGQAARVSQTAVADELTRFLAGGDLGVLSSSHDDAAETARFAAAAASCHLTWLPIVAQPSQVRVGPRVGYGCAPCHLCHSARLAQYGLAAGTPTRDPGNHGNLSYESYEMEGYQPYLATLAAGLALILSPPEAREEITAPNGRFFLVDIESDAISAQQLIPVHGCPGCHSAANSTAAMRRRNEVLRTFATRPLWAGHMSATEVTR